MLIFCNAEGVHGQRKVGSPCSSQNDQTWSVVVSVACRGGQTGRRPRASKAGGRARSEITNV